MRRVLAFFAVLMFAAGLAWLGGYNFDQRHPGVAIGTLIAVVFAALAATCPLFDRRD